MCCRPQRGALCQLWLMISRGLLFCSYFQTGRPTTYHLSHHPQCHDVPGPAAQCPLCHCKSQDAAGTPCQHIKTPVFCQASRIMQRHLEMSHLQLSDSICTYNITLCTPFESSLFATGFFCGAKVHDAQSWGAALLFCQRNSISQLHAVKW